MQPSPAFWIFLIMCLRKISTYEPCDGAYCPPSMAKPKINPIDNSGFAPLFLGKDAISGCICREYPGVYVVCFGRNQCHRMPQDINITTPMLKLTNTHLTELKPGDFDTLRHLEGLQIEGNFNLSKILPGTFNVNMTNLTNVSISYNPNLKRLFPLSFQGLVNLRTLYLIKNGFETVYDITVSLAVDLLPNLFKLSLNENNFVTVFQDDFSIMEGSAIQELSLVLCRLDYLHPKSLLPLKKLQVLRLGENSFNASAITDLITTIVENEIPLKALNLFSVGFRKAPPRKLMEALARSNVSNLNLARNQFEVISFDFFPYMPNLRILDLREVLALEIHNDAFANLPNLRTLLLSGNKLATIPQGVLLANLTYLDLQQNSGNVYSQSYFSVSKGVFSNMKQLTYLNLNYNRLNGLCRTSFIGLKNLKVLGLKNATIYHVQSRTFEPLINLIFLNLENNYFVGNNIPPGIDEEMFKGLEKLEVLLLGGCGITHITDNKNPFSYLTSLEHLGLERNQLKTLSPTDFLPLVQLKTIDVSDNLLSVWEQRIFEYNVNLEMVILNRNKLSLLTYSMLEDFSNLTQLELLHNPLTCDCHSYTIFYQWYSDKKEVKHVDVRAHCVFPESVSNYTMVEYFKKVHNGSLICDTNDFPANLVVILPLVLLVLFFLVLSVFVYYYRWHLRYWVFLTRLYLSRRGKIKPKREKTTYTNYLYDAFVSYSNEDRNFVVRLVSMLESYEPFLKLCVYERDFQIGTIISESVLESVAQSRRTLLIISDNYAKSQWCRWESQIAEHHRLFFENEDGEYVDDSLVLIKLGPVSENHLTPTLKYLLKTRIYLQWEADEKKQKVFWEKLRNALAPPKHEQIVLECTHI